MVERPGTPKRWARVAGSSELTLTVIVWQVILGFPSRREPR